MMNRTTAQLGGVFALACCGALGLLAARGSDETDSSAPPSAADRHFETEIVPLLRRHCLECHGSSSKKGRLDLSLREGAFAGGESGAVIVPGKVEESLLWDYVDSGEMPPKNRPPLSDREKRLLKEWIASGADWPLESIAPVAFADERIAPHHEFECGDETRDPGPALLQRLTVAEYVETVRRAVGVDIGQEARRILPPDVRADGFSNTAYNLNVDLANVEGYAELARIIVEEMDVAAFVSGFASCRELSDSCMRQLIDGMGKWLLRGPLGESEIEAFLGVSKGVAEEGGDFVEAAGYLIEAMLQSPRFIYRLENHRGDGSIRPVGDYELASRLSYILWGGPPDRELLKAADEGRLSDRGEVASQVRRMLEDPRAVEKSTQFIYEWLNLGQLSNLRPDSNRFPQWNQQLASDMREETLAFFKEIAWEQNRPLADLLNAQVTFATPRLAEFYGLDAASARPVDGSLVKGPQRVTKGLQLLYRFDEGKGDVVRDASGRSEPLDLKISDSSAVRWSDAGLTVTGSTLIASERPPGRLVEAVQSTGEITLEAWITPESRSQGGPARILTLSDGISNRNFTLGQDGNKYDVRFRTTARDANGMRSLSSPGGVVDTRPTHVVYTRGATGTGIIYVNGEEVVGKNVEGELSNWDARFPLALANELSKDRPWKGTLHLVAVYDRVLSPEETQQNYAAGVQSGRLSPPAGLASLQDRLQQDLLALYKFDEGTGEAVRDTSNAGDPLDLTIEDVSAVKWEQGGLSVNGSTLIATAGPARRLSEALKKSNAVTLEAWVTPRDAKQDGPARILTLSSGTSRRNFTLGQDGDRYDVRFRTTRNNHANGHPSLNSPGGTAGTRLTHVVYTRNSSGLARLYVDGEERGSLEAGGDLSNWDDDFRLVLANESSKDRPWKGTLHRVAIYRRALTASEIRWKEERLSRYDLTSVPARGGLLTQGSALTVGGDEASMVARGLFVLEDLLCSHVGSPPPCLDVTPVPSEPGLSRRAIAMTRLADASCSGCHSRFEPLAFGLEKFDGIGAYHEIDEHGNELRDDGEILFPGREEPLAYETSAELMDLLAGSDRVRESITLKLTQFALGRPLVKTDACLLAEIHTSAWENGGTYADLISAIVMSGLVQTTRTEETP